MSFVRIVDFSNIKNLYISNKPLKTPAHHYPHSDIFGPTSSDQQQHGSEAGQEVKTF